MKTLETLLLGMLAPGVLLLARWAGVMKGDV